MECFLLRFHICGEPAQLLDFDGNLIAILKPWPMTFFMTHGDAFRCSREDDISRLQRHIV